MEDYLVFKEIAEDLRLLEFGNPCLRGINSKGVVVNSMWGVNYNGMMGYTSIPFSPQVLDWARETYNIFAYVVPTYCDDKRRFSFLIGKVAYTELCFETPHAAYMACVIEIIEYIKMLENERKSVSDTRLGEQEDNQSEVPGPSA